MHKVRDVHGSSEIPKERLNISIADGNALSTKIREYREEHQLPITKEGQRFRNLWREKSELLFYIDLETATGSMDIFEICVWDVNGNPIINEAINYSTADSPFTIRQLYDRFASAKDQGVIRKIYGPPSDLITPGKTWEEVADALSNYFGPQTHIIE